MRGLAWLTLRQAREALNRGRLEEAQTLLQEPTVQGYRRTGDLRLQLAQQFVERGDRQLRLDDPEGAWADLLRAENLGGAQKAADRLRHALTGLGLAELRAYLGAGETRRAQEVVDRLRDRGVRSVELSILEDALAGWRKAYELADLGEFASAFEALERGRRVLADNSSLHEFYADLQRRNEGFGVLLGSLFEAANQGAWRTVVEKAEAVLALAPQHSEARTLRGRAWRALEPPTIHEFPNPSFAVNAVNAVNSVGSVGMEAMRLSRTPTESTSATLGPGFRAKVISSGANARGIAETQTPAALAEESLPSRFLLWIDGVGGYLVCLGPRLSFGQATLDSRVDIPLIADVSRLHALLNRDSEGYILEAVRPVQVNGQSVPKILLANGDRFTLGTTCQFVFRMPVVGSMTARLDLVSGHRLSLAVDGVLLMAETLVLGRGANVHIAVDNLDQPVVLFRHKEGLGVRAAGEVRVNREKVKRSKESDRVLLPANASVQCADLVFAIEAVSGRLGPG